MSGGRYKGNRVFGWLMRTVQVLFRAADNNLWACNNCEVKSVGRVGGS